ncbi:MAG: hypothetical protein M3Y25_00430, partial [Thermoproteota archaeon]|nr:hypothetical protein [Thermoproteota archaeon]
YNLRLILHYGSLSILFLLGGYRQIPQLFYPFFKPNNIPLVFFGFKNNSSDIKGLIVSKV